VHSEFWVNSKILKSAFVSRATNPQDDYALPPTSSLYSCKAGVHTQRLVASADYLAQVSTPSNPQQLTDMALLNYTGTQTFALWTFSQGNQKITIEPKAVYTSNNNYALYQAALNGMGIANL
jgi:LysR family transcriptional regulator for bpeEF and oprC